MEIVLDYEPFPHQIEAHEDISRFIGINGGRRVGKSEYAIMELIKHAVDHPAGLSWYLAPTYKDAKEIGWEKFVAYRSVLRPIIRYWNYTNLTVTWKNNHQTFFKGTENRTSLRGRGLTFAILDEVAFQHPDVWYKIVRPALMDTGGGALLLTTPNGRNWYYNLHTSDSTFSTYTWPTSLNPIISPAELDSIKSSLSMTDYRQEILAEFVTQAGMVYDDFTDDNTVDNPTLSLEDVALGVDFGFANPTAICFFDYNRIDDIVTQFAEIYKERTDITTLIKLIEDKLTMFGISKSRVKIYTDPAGNAEELSSGESPVDMMRKAGFTVLNKGSRIMPGISMLRSYICSANGKRRFFVTKNCKESIRSLLGYTYKTTATTNMINEEPLKDGLNDHICDAIRYYFVNKFDQAKWVAKEVNASAYVPGNKRQMKPKRCIICKGMFLSDTPKHVAPFKCNKCTGE